jgi:hypothetical protein
MSKNISIDTLDTVKIQTYGVMVAMFYLLYFLAFFGIYYVNPDYIHFLSISIQLFICGFLMWSFNPFIKQELRIYDRQIIFAAAFFLLNNVVIIEFDSFFNNPIQKNTDAIKAKIFGIISKY